MKLKKYKVEITFFAEATKTGKPTKWSPAVVVRMLVEATSRQEAEHHAQECIRRERYDHIQLVGVQMMAFQSKATVA